MQHNKLILISMLLASGASASTFTLNSSLGGGESSSTASTNVYIFSEATMVVTASSGPTFPLLCPASNPGCSSYISASASFGLSGGPYAPQTVYGGSYTSNCNKRCIYEFYDMRGFGVFYRLDPGTYIATTSIQSGCSEDTCLPGSGGVSLDFTVLRGDVSFTNPIASPEPSSILLFGSGVVGLAYGFIRKRRPTVPPLPQAA